MYLLLVVSAGEKLIEFRFGDGLWNECPPKFGVGGCRSTTSFHKSKRKHDKIRSINFALSIFARVEKYFPLLIWAKKGGRGGERDEGRRGIGRGGVGEGGIPPKFSAAHFERASRHGLRHSLYFATLASATLDRHWKKKKWEGGGGVSEKYLLSKKHYYKK